VVKTDGEAGAFHFDLLLDASGPWEWRWASTGAVVAADEGKLVVRGSRFSVQPAAR
jgi:hypothetical protein